MGSLELGPEADVSDLEPLLTLENIEQLEATFVAKVQVSSWSPGSEQFCRHPWACICGVVHLPISSSVSALLHPAAPCPLSPGKGGPVAAEGTGWGGSRVGPRAGTRHRPVWLLPLAIASHRAAGG